MLQLLDTIEDEVVQGGYLIDWHACDLFPKSWIDLVVVLRCPSTSILYDRLSARCVYPRDSSVTKKKSNMNCQPRGYSKAKLDENMDAEIFGTLLEEAREAYDVNAVVELTSEDNDDIEQNCARIVAWIAAWKRTLETSVR
jgi:broad-specificity NMP kinase